MAANTEEQGSKIVRIAGVRATRIHHGEALEAGMLQDCGPYELRICPFINLLSCRNGQVSLIRARYLR